MSENSTMGPQARTIAVDAEHFGVRFMVPVMTIGLTLLVHVIGMVVLDAVLTEGANPACVMLPVDAVVLIALGFGSERVLKRLFPSRRKCLLSDDALEMRDARRQPPVVTTIEWDGTVNVLAWRFSVKRKTRVPKGWHCLALQLLQDDESLILYTFMAPEEAEAAIGYDNFVRLRPRKETESNTDLKAVAEQRRLLKLEDERWNDGAEIGKDDFHAILATLQRHIPGWI